MGGFREQLKSRRSDVVARVRRPSEHPDAEGGVDDRPEEASQLVFPKDFFTDLRALVEGGLTKVQLIAFLKLVHGMKEAMGRFDGDELLSRLVHAVSLIDSDLENTKAAREWMERVRNAREKGRG